jgi:hypothetical protein
LAEAAARHGCAVHAYALMTNHVRIGVRVDFPGLPDILLV